MKRLGLSLQNQNQPRKLIFNANQHNTSFNNEHENTDQDEEECVLSDEINLHTVTPQEKKKLSEMLLETSLFQPTNHHSWGNGWSLDADDVSTVDLESLEPYVHLDSLQECTQILGRPHLNLHFSELAAHLLGVHNLIIVHV